MVLLYVIIHRCKLVRNLINFFFWLKSTFRRNQLSLYLLQQATVQPNHTKPTESNALRNRLVFDACTNVRCSTYIITVFCYPQTTYRHWERTGWYCNEDGCVYSSPTVQSCYARVFVGSHLVRCHVFQVGFVHRKNKTK